MENYLEFEVYKLPNEMYLKESLVEKFNLHRFGNQKRIHETNCFKINKYEIEEIEKRYNVKAKYIPIIELDIKANFEVLTYNNIGYYVTKSLCSRYKINSLDEKIINNKIYCKLTLEQINEIEEISREKKLPIIKNIIKIDQKDIINFCYFEKRGKTYISRDVLEVARHYNSKVEAKPVIINDKNCYSIKKDEIFTLEGLLNSFATKIILDKIGEPIIVYKDKKDDKLYIPEIYNYCKNSNTKVIMNKICKETSEKELETIYNKRFVIASVYTKQEKRFIPKEIVNITICDFNGRLFIEEKAFEKLNIINDNNKKIKVDGIIYLEVSTKEITDAREMNKDRYIINFNKRNIVRR